MENFYFPEIEKVEKFCRHQKSQRRRHRDEQREAHSAEQQHGGEVVEAGLGPQVRQRL